MRDGAGQPIARLTTNGFEQKVTPFRLRNPDLTVLLVWWRFADGHTMVGIRSLQSINESWQWRTLYGWGLKHAEMTAATRASLTADGVLSVEWDLGDPASHTRVREYQLQLHQDNVNLISEALRPQHEQLVRPDDPQGVLQAAYVAAIHGLDAELSQYFSSATVMEAFKATAVPVPYELGHIDLAHVEVLDQYCNFDLEPARPGADGAAPFFISIGGGIYLDLTMGTVTFGSDAMGGTVIEGLAVTNRCPNRTSLTPPEPPAPREKQLTIWAVDPNLQRPHELLFAAQMPDTTLAGVSPDGRYFLLRQHLGLYKGDDRAIPHLRDHHTGTLVAGPELNMRTAIWSGSGFWIDDLLHLNLDMTVTEHLAPSEALGVTEERGIRSLSFAADSGRMAALMGKSWSPDRFDLAWADLEGSAATRLPDGFTPVETQMGNIATVALSPDGRYVAVSAWEPALILIDTTNPSEEGWVQIQAPLDRRNWNLLAWAPDSEHLLVGGLGVVDLIGDLVLPHEDGGAVWSADGKALIIPASADQPWTLAPLDGERQEFWAPPSWPWGSLPDGRLITSIYDPGPPN